MGVLAMVIYGDFLVNPEFWIMSVVFLFCLLECIICRGM